MISTIELIVVVLVAAIIAGAVGGGIVLLFSHRHRNCFESTFGLLLEDGSVISPNHGFSGRSIPTNAIVIGFRFPFLSNGLVPAISVRATWRHEEDVIENRHKPYVPFTMISHGPGGIDIILESSLSSDYHSDVQISMASGSVNRRLYSHRFSWETSDIEALV